MDLFAFLSNMGLDGAWLPLLVALVAVPTQYVLLGMGAHQEFREVVGSIAIEQGVLSVRERYNLASEAASNLRIFELDWWIVSAFAILVTMIIASGYLGDWTKVASAAPAAAANSYRCTAQTVDRLICSSLAGETTSNVKKAMSLYATVVSLLVGFRLGWARLQLAKQLSGYYVLVSERQEKEEEKMPPSGYDQKQANYVHDFLLSCATALLAEAREKGISPASALDDEVRSISDHLEREPVSAAQKAALELTKAFYQSVRATSPSDEDSFNRAVYSASNDIRNEIVSVKVAERVNG